MNSRKKYLFFAILIALFILMVGRLFSLQIATDKYYLSSIKNVANEVTLYADRGIVYDRNGELLVYNDVVYDLAVEKRKVRKDLDTVALCKILKMDTAEFAKKMGSIRVYIPHPFMKDLPQDIYVPLQENIDKFEGFILEQKTDRRYKHSLAAHILGYTGEVSDRELKDDAYYQLGESIGKTGLEAEYEKYLRGYKGVKVVIRDSRQIERGSYKAGALDSAPIAGRVVYSSIDFYLQEMAEKMLSNKIGSIVAIEPSTGEILALANSPTYELNKMIGSSRTKNYIALLRDPNKPFFNRAIKARYPPGSTFKTVQALIGLQQGIVENESTYPCYGGYRMGRLKVGCHAHPPRLNLPQSIQKSCNAWYCYLFKEIIEDSTYLNVANGYHNWRNYLLKFGIGEKTGIDLPNEGSGFVPDTGFFNRYYGKGRWKSSMIISLSIGQGEMGVTPLQIANYAACIANRGFWITPHVVKKIEGLDTLPSQYTQRHETGIATTHFEKVIEGMSKVVAPGGTARGAAIPGLEVCGKTGTSQNPHGKDHSLFIAFAPRDNPKIAVACIVENGGYGATYAAPMATVLLERYLAGHDSTFVSKKPILYDRMCNAKLKNFSKDTSNQLTQ
jgi:penicillin-binding protein 2